VTVLALSAPAWALAAVLALSAPAWALAAVLAVTAAAAGLAYVLLVRGSLGLDIGWGRSVRTLGPVVVQIGAPRELVFEVVASAYTGHGSREVREKLEVLERGSDMVLAAHFTRVRGFTVTTVETVRFSPPERVDFRLVRGPVPHVVERFVLREVPEGTELEYSGEMGADLWWLGRAWSRRVARIWTEVVNASLGEVKAVAQQRTEAQERRER